MRIDGAIGRSNATSSTGAFIRLPENRAGLRAILGLAAIESRIDPPRRTHPLLYLHGAPGTGKSRLVQTLFETIVARRPDRTICIVPARDLGKALTGQIQDETDLVRESRSSDVLVIEDLQHLTLVAGPAVARLIDERWSRRRAVVATASMGPAQLHLPLPLTSRLAGGLVVRLGTPGQKSRALLARRWCEERNIQVTDEVTTWLARRSVGGARSLRGDILRLHRLSQLCPPPLDLASVSAYLASTDDHDRASTLQIIADRVAARFDLKPERLLSRIRRRELLWPRHVSMYLAREGTGASLASIGVFFGGFDHSTVLHAVKKVRERRTTDPQFDREIKELIS